ncbi:hypothetical protein M422DRAFT_261228 [Sphaerobolus stellatus SS14]|uniref:Uncharacterized protein n=1 Tax=Sphaerobolus stellatus (strain SS14) TaxID=990650 RepID=A0A0C9VFV9_SPHS4|nr:hypothetical protein M422DRAFT_261228 [Sphaerobolus stellatus SS14]
MAALEHPAVKKHILDVTSDEHVKDIVQRIMKEEGRIDMLINNAGIPLAGALADIPAEDMSILFDVNVVALHRTARAVIPHMAKQKEGLIMNVGSIVGEIPTPWMGAYEASKAAVKVMTEVLSLECKPLDIRVMLLAPASVTTQIYKSYKDFQLPDGSLYQKYLPNIKDRVAHGKVQKVTMSAERFADEVITKAVSKRPPYYLLLGGGSWLFRFLCLLPRRLMLNLVWRRYSKPIP